KIELHFLQILLTGLLPQNSPYIFPISFSIAHKFLKATSPANRCQTSSAQHQTLQIPRQDKDKNQRGSIASILFLSVILKACNRHSDALPFLSSLFSNP